MSDCPFCKRIGEGEYEATENPNIVTFEPLRPVTPGHRLFLPREHIWDFRSRPKVLGRVMAQAAAWPLNADSNLIASSGRNATQTVMHFHVHLVPRRADDGLHLPWTGQA